MLIEYFSSFSVEVAWTPWRTFVGSIFKKKKFIRAGASFELYRSIPETFGEWDNGRGVGVTLTLKRCQFIFLPDRVCLPGKSGKFGSEVAICRDSHRAGWQEAARVWTQAA